MEIDKTRLKDNIKLLAICIPVLALLFFLDNRYAAKTNLSTDFKSTDIEVDGLVINEIMSSNKGVYVDENGKLYDWIELYNGTNSDINLKNYGLSDSLDEKVKWLFPDVTIESKGYLIIYLTEMETDGLYAPFSLKRTGGENLTLRSSSGDIIDTVKTLNVPKNKNINGVLTSKKEKHIFYTLIQKNEDTFKIILNCRNCKMCYYNEELKNINDKCKNPLDPLKEKYFLIKTNEEKIFNKMYYTIFSENIFEDDIYSIYIFDQNSPKFIDQSVSEVCNTPCKLVLPLYQYYVYSEQNIILFIPDDEQTIIYGKVEIMHDDEAFKIGRAHV